MQNNYYDVDLTGFDDGFEDIAPSPSESGDGGVDLTGFDDGFESIDSLQDEGGMIDALSYGVQSTANRVGATIDTLQGDTRELMEGVEAANSIGATQAQREFRQAIHDRKSLNDESIWQGVKNVFSAAWEHPEGAFHETIGQLPNSGVVMGSMLAGAKSGAVAGTAIAPGAGTVIGTIAGGIVGMFLGNAAVETGAIAQDHARDGSFTREDQLTTLKQGATKAGVITGIDALTLGINKAVAGIPGKAVEGAITKTLVSAGVDATSDSAVRVALNNPVIKHKAVQAAQEAFEAATGYRPRAGMGATAFATETVGEGAGEYLGSSAAGLDASFTEAAMESLMSMPQSVGEIYVAKQLGSEGANTKLLRDSGKPKNAPPEQNQAAPEPDPLDSMEPLDITGIDLTGIEDDLAEFQGIDVTAEHGPVPASQQAPISAIDEMEPVDIETGGTESQDLTDDQRLSAIDFLENDLTATQLQQRSQEEELAYQQQQALGDQQKERAWDSAQVDLAVVNADLENAKLENSPQSQPANPAVAEALYSAADAAGIEDIKAKIASDRTLRDQVKALKLRKQSEAAAQKEKKRRAVNPLQDDILVALAKTQGINRAEAEAQGIDPAHFNLQPKGGKGFYLFPKEGGMSLDQAAEYLSQDGYLPTEYSANDALDKLSSALSGEWIGTPDGMALEAQRQLEDDMLLRKDADSDAALDEWAANSAYQEDIVEGTQPDEVILNERFMDAFAAGVPLDAIRDILDGGSDEIHATTKQLEEAISNAENLRPRASEAQPGEILETAEQDEDGIPGFDESSQATTTASAKNPTTEELDAEIDAIFGPDDSAPILNTYSESDLTDREEKTQAAQQADNQAKQQEEQRAQADVERDDFLLTGSDRPADVAASRGQQDLLDAQPSKQEIDSAAHEAATSHKNDLPEPTEAQKEAGNYKKGEPFTLHSMKIVIENPKGSKRKGTDPDGTQWENTMGAAYGDIKGTIGADGDALDVFVGPKPDSEKVWIIDQADWNGNFDEHKVFVGFPNQLEAVTAYKKSYDKGWKVGPVTKMSVDELQEWLKGDTTKPVSDKSKIGQDSKNTVLDKGDAQPTTTNVESGMKPQGTEDLSSESATTKHDAKGELTTKGTKLADKSAEKFEDFGERLEGANKHNYTLREALSSKDIDVAAVPLSKSFPQPDYEKLAASGVDPVKLAQVARLRAGLGNKPRAKHKVKRWADEVDNARNIAEMLLNPDATFKFEDAKSPSARADIAVSEIATEILPSQIKELGNYSMGQMHFSLYKGKENVNKWEVENIANSSGFGGMGNKSYFDTKEEALAYIKSQVTTVDTNNKPLAKFDVWTTRGEKGFFVGKKIGTGKYIELEKFDSSKDARAYIASHNAELVDLLKKKKHIGAHRRAEQNERVGRDYRRGKNVTSDLFAETFGFRGVQFGNWVENDKRQQDVNNAYDGLLDLAEVIGIPPKAISLNGELGLAFGARGKGGKDAAKAHYEQDQVVINLTKKDGAGSLAHEWWHALDNYFGKKDGNLSKGSGFLTESKRSSRTRDMVDGVPTYRGSVAEDFGVRKDVYKAYQGIVSTIKNDTDLVSRSAVLDGRKTKNYWATQTELTARAFERYVIDKLASSGYESDYLATILPKGAWDASEAIFGNTEESYPYPTDKEIEATNPAYQKLFDTIKTKEAGKRIILYSKSAILPKGATPKGMKSEDVEQIAKDFLKTYKGADDGLDVRVYRTEEDAFGRNATRASGPAKSKIKGGYYPKENRLVLIASSLDSRQDAVATLQHELLVHKGLGLFRPEHQQAIINSILKGAPESSTLAPIWTEIQKDYADQSETVQAEELLAKVAEQKLSVFDKHWNRIVNAIRKALESIGFIKSNGLSRRDLIDTIYRMGDAFKEGHTAQPRPDDSPMFSRSSDPVDDIAEETAYRPIRPGIRDRLDAVRFQMQDKLIDLKRAQEGVDTEDDANPYQKAAIWEGKAGERLNDFDEQHVQPLLEKIAATNLSLEDVGEWLVARHAEEANAYLAEINPDKPVPDRYRLSGMSNDQAAAILSGKANNGNLQEVGGMIDRINQNRVKLLIKYDLIDQETADNWQGRYRHYVPLKREEAEGSDHLPPRGQGFSLKGKESKSRTGAAYWSPANIIANTLAQHESSIVRSEKNEVAKSLLKFVEQNPDENFWTVDDERIMSVVRNGKVVEGVKPFLGPNELAVKVDGKERVIVFNSQNPKAARLASGLKNLQAAEMGAVMRALSAYTRFLSSVNTSWNPEFMVSNFFRDVQTAAYNLSDTDISNMQGRVIKDIPKAMNGIRSSLFGDGSAEWSSTWEEFRTHGGKTGWIDLHNDILKKEHRLKSTITRLQEGKPGKHQFLRFLEGVDNMNVVVENGVRLAAYKNARDAGLSKDKAASLAKELTVNFNRKGNSGPTMNALYMFYNAAVQGNLRLVQAMANSKKGRHLAYATIGFAFFLDMINRSLSGDDDDGENIYDGLPDHIKNHNIIIMGEKEPLIKIPAPWGYNVLHTMGQVMGSAATSERFNVLDEAARVALSIIDAFNPVGSGTIAQVLSPTLSDPIVQMAENKNFAGNPLKPEHTFDSRAPKPEYLMHWSTAREASKDIAMWLNFSSGGDSVYPGKVNISPEWIDLLIDHHTGGVGRLIANTTDTAQRLVQGKEIPPENIPFVRKITGYNSDYGVKGRYYEWSKEVIYTREQIKNLTGNERAEAIKKKQSRLISRYNATEKQLKDLRKKRRYLAANSADEKTIEKVDEQMRRVMSIFNKSYSEVVFKKE